MHTMSFRYFDGMLENQYYLNLNFLKKKFEILQGWLRNFLE